MKYIRFTDNFDEIMKWADDLGDETIKGTVMMVRRTGDDPKVSWLEISGGKMGGYYSADYGDLVLYNAFPARRDLPYQDMVKEICFGISACDQETFDRLYLAKGEKIRNGN